MTELPEKMKILLELTESRCKTVTLPSAACRRHQQHSLLMYELRLNTNVDSISQQINGH